MIGKISITYEGSARLLVPGGRRILNQITRAAWNRAGIFWHTRMAPKHFTHAAYSEYDYTPRTGKYQKAKKRKYGHNLPLVFSGDSRRLAATQDVRPFTGSVATVREFVSMSGSKIRWKERAGRVTGGVRIVIHATGLNRRPGIHARINLRDEMTRVSDREGRQIVKVLRSHYIKGIEAIRGQKTKTVSS